MIRRPHCVALVSVLGILIVSCAPGRRNVLTDAKTLPADVLAARLEERDRHIRTMTGKGSVAFESADMAGSAFFDLSLKKPDSLLLSFEGPFGIDAGFLFLCRQKFVMYNSFDNRAITGIPTTRAIRGVIPIDLTFDQIMDAFAGGFRLPGDVPVRYEVEDEEVRATYERDGQQHDYWIDPATDLVIRYDVRDSTGSLLMQALATRPIEQENLYVPGHVTLTFPTRGQQLSIHYSSVDVNTGAPSFDYKVPVSARITIR